MMTFVARTIALSAALLAACSLTFAAPADTASAAPAKAPIGDLTSSSGLIYHTITEGTGRSPMATDTVKVHYRGTLLDGTEFDSSYAHGKPVTFTVNRVIPGWQEVIPRMHVGDKWKVVIPPSQAYGERGELPRIGPNEALVFDIELVDIKQ